MIFYSGCDQRYTRQVITNKQVPVNAVSCKFIPAVMDQVFHGHIHLSETSSTNKRLKTDADFPPAHGDAFGKLFVYSCSELPREPALYVHCAKSLICHILGVRIPENGTRISKIRTRSRSYSAPIPSFIISANVQTYKHIHKERYSVKSIHLAPLFYAIGGSLLQGGPKNLACFCKL